MSAVGCTPRVRFEHQFATPMGRVEVMTDYSEEEPRLRTVGRTIEVLGRAICDLADSNPPTDPVDLNFGPPYVLIAMGRCDYDEGFAARAIFENFEESK